MVAAAVPAEYLALFIGHKIWARPADAAQTQPATWHTLIDTWLTLRGERRMTIDVDGTPCAAMVANMIHVDGLDETQCRKNTYPGFEWWEWQPPANTQPALF